MVAACQERLTRLQDLQPSWDLLQDLMSSKIPAAEDGLVQQQAKQLRLDVQVSRLHMNLQIVSMQMWNRSEIKIKTAQKEETNVRIHTRLQANICVHVAVTGRQGLHMGMGGCSARSGLLPCYIFCPWRPATPWPGVRRRVYVLMGCVGDGVRVGWCSGSGENILFSSNTNPTVRVQKTHDSRYSNKKLVVLWQTLEVGTPKSSFGCPELENQPTEFTKATTTTTAWPRIFAEVTC